MEKPPTRIRVYYPDTEVGMYLCANLCQLGYTVIVDKFFKEHPILTKFYHLEIDLNGSKTSDWVFDVGDKKVTISRPLYPKLWEYYNQTHPDDFVRFMIYHWGLTRGGRPLYESPIYVDYKMVDKWDLIKYIDRIDQ